MYLSTNVRVKSCTYCGDWATELDHVIPVSYLGRRARGKKRFRPGDWLVPACRDCNAALGAHALLTVPDRAGFLLEKFSKKWDRHLRSPKWEDDEVADLTGTFRGLIERVEEVRDAVIRRLGHLSMVSEMDPDYLRP